MSTTAVTFVAAGAIYRTALLLIVQVKALDGLPGFAPGCIAWRLASGEVP